MLLNEPVIGERFFGRTETLNLLKKRVSALTEGYRQNIALTGQNLSGKSSILHHFLYEFRDNRILPIYVEVTDEPFVYFSQRFIGSLLFNFLKSKGHDPKEDFDTLINDARMYIPHTVRSILDIQDLIKKRDFDSAYSGLFDLTGAVKNETGKSCVIILDEFHNLASLNVRHPFKNFGKKIMVQKDTMYIVTSSQVTAVKKILEEKLSLLFGNFEIVPVRGFNARNASSFLDQRFKYMRMPEEYKNFIISFTEGNPFYLDIISQAVKNAVTAKTFMRINEEVLVQALETTVFNSMGCIFQYFNSTLETSVKKKKPWDIYIAILLAVANGSARLKEISRAVKKRTGDVSRYLSELIDLNLLCNNGALYNFTDKVFSFWLKFVYQKKRSAIVSYLPDRIDIFRKEAMEIVKNYIADEKKDIIFRASSLFSLFNNEVVSISDKEYKLQSFSFVDIKHFENGSPYILSKSNNKCWIASVSPEEVKDIDILEFIERVKSLGTKTHRKILIALSGIEMNAHLMAKEANVWIWDVETLNQLMALYGKDMIVSCVYNGKVKKSA